MKADLIASLESLFAVIDRGLVFCAVLCLCAIGLMTTIDVAMRYMFNSPLTFAFDLTSMYLFPASVLLILADVNRHNENIDIDLFARKLTLAQWRWTSAAGGLAAFAIFGTITLMYIGKAVDAYRAGESTFGAISWPVWPAMAVAATGFGFLSLSIATRSIQHLLGRSARQSAGPADEKELA